MFESGDIAAPDVEKQRATSPRWASQLWFAILMVVVFILSYYVHSGVDTVGGANKVSGTRNRRTRSNGRQVARAADQEVEPHPRTDCSGHLSKGGDARDTTPPLGSTGVLRSQLRHQREVRQRGLRLLSRWLELRRGRQGIRCTEQQGDRVLFARIRSGPPIGRTSHEMADRRPPQCNL